MLKKNKNYILDTSFCCAFLFPDEYNEEIFGVLRHIVKSNGNILVPRIFIYEILNAFCAACNSERFSEENENYIFFLIEKFNESINVFNIFDLVNLFDLCMKHDLTSYDGAYLEVALEFPGILCTLDKALLKAAKAEGVTVWEPGFKL